MLGSIMLRNVGSTFIESEHTEQGKEDTRAKHFANTLVVSLRPSFFNGAEADCAANCWLKIRNKASTSGSFSKLLCFSSRLHYEGLVKDTSTCLE